MIPAVLLAAAYLVWAPPSADLAAQTFRTELFEAHGYEVWTTAWYGGLHLPAYSLLLPPLASVLGIRLVGAISVVCAAWLFGALVRPRYGERARLAVWLFGLGAATNLYTGRITFALGLALALGALVAFDRGRPIAAALLAALASCGSPVAGLFLAFAGGVLFVTGRRREGLVLAVPSLGAIGVLSLAFPTGGVEPFETGTFVLISAATLLTAAVLPARERTLRVGAVLYALMCLALFVLDTPVGGNATRLGALAAAPMLALGAWGRRPTALVVAALLPLLYWQWVAPVRDLSDAVGEPSVERAYYEPLLAELEARVPDEAYRVHVPPTRNRWEAAYVAPAHPLARGWLRQAESGDFDLFEHGNLTATAYREWLDRRSVAFVAISAGAQPDYLSRDEIALVRAGLPYLHEAWSNGDWELYEVADPRPIAEPPLTLTEDGFRLEAPHAGEFEVAVGFSPYFRVVEGSGCVRDGGKDFSVVEAAAPGTIEAEADFTVGGAFGAATDAAEVCSDR